jgi:hypothetical protein
MKVALLTHPAGSAGLPSPVLTSWGPQGSP